MDIATLAKRPLPVVVRISQAVRLCLPGASHSVKVEQCLEIASFEGGKSEEDRKCLRKGTQ